MNNQLLDYFEQFHHLISNYSLGEEEVYFVVVVVGEEVEMVGWEVYFVAVVVVVGEVEMVGWEGYFVVVVGEVEMVGWEEYFGVVVEGREADYQQHSG